MMMMIINGINGNFTKNGNVRAKLDDGVYACVVM